MSDYADLVVRLRAGLMDADGVVWQSGELDEALRQALSDMGLAAGAMYTVIGLDGAATTSLPPEHFATLIRGAAAYAMLWRAIERIDAFSQNANLPSQVLAAAAALLARFETALTHLAALRQAQLQTAAASPYPTGADGAQAGWTLPDDLSPSGG
ncbi:hypothetical protein EG834_07095 [bacterium]|nr:hypothetical protein [bacterium]